GEVPGARVAPPPFGVGVGGDREPLAVRRPRRAKETAGLVRIALDAVLPGQIAQLSSLEVEQPDVGLVAVTRGDERERRPVGRKHGLIVDRVTYGKTL